MSTLLDAVDALTLVTHHRIRQDVMTTFLVTTDQGDQLRKPVEQQHDTGDTRTVIATEPPLLDQLDDAVSSSIGGSQSGASLTSERNVLRPDALFEAIKIRSLITDWCIRAGVAFDRNEAAAAMLRRWYASTLAGDIDTGWHESVLNGWVGEIRGMLNPPRELDLPQRCPACDADTWWNRATGEQIGRPLVIRYRDGEDMVERAKGLCRACEVVWNSVRELAYDLEHAEENNNTTA